MTYVLSNLERETVITFNAAEKTAKVYTCDPYVFRRLDNMTNVHPDTCTVLCEDSYSKTYVVPKKYVRVVAPRKISEDAKKAQAERLRKLAELRKKNTEEEK